MTIGGKFQNVGTCIDSIIERQIIQTIFQFDDIQSATVMNGDMNFRQFVDMSGDPALKDHIYIQ